PVFVDLRGPEAGAMWRMLTERGTDLRVELLERSVDGDRGSARWRAHYTFSQTGRPVVNDVRASMRFADGLIADHVDDFDFHRWARQALGTSGLLLGWTPWLRNAVRHRPGRASTSTSRARTRGPAARWPAPTRRRRRDGRGRA